MSSDALLRTLAVVVAVAILAAPYRGLVVDAVKAAQGWINANAASLGRIVAAGLIVAAAWGKLPLPEILGVGNVPAVVVPTPSAEMQRLVEPVTKALAGLPADKRALWAATWTKAAVVVEAEGATTVAVLTDTPSLRLCTTVALDVAWRRLGDVPPGSVTGLREGVEVAMRSALGLDSVPITADIKGRYADVARAIAWAATR